VIYSFVCLSPHAVYSVLPVEPVELHAIRRAQVELRGGTGGTGDGRGFWWREKPVPPVTLVGSTENRQKGLKYHRFHRLHLPHDGPRTSLKALFPMSLESIS
jgi:hypothetical protein